MTRDEVIALLVADGGTPGKRCRGRLFDLAAAFDFRECCASNTARYPRREFVARGPKGGLWHIGMSTKPRSARQITFTHRGYHHRRGTKPCV